jgi:hypothetical protein
MKKGEWMSCVTATYSEEVVQPLMLRTESHVFKVPESLLVALEAVLALQYRVDRHYPQQVELFLFREAAQPLWSLAA